MKYAKSQMTIVDNRDGRVLGTIEAAGWSAAMRLARKQFPSIHPANIGLVDNGDDADSPEAIQYRRRFDEGMNEK